jgi:hypothetical protein
MDEKTNRVFEFSKELDSATIADLYGEDTQHAQEVFSDFIKQADLFLESSESLIQDDKLPEFRRIVHKFKPMFFYTGLISFYDQFQEFENCCEKATHTTDLNSEYKSVKKNLVTGKKIIESEILRLQAFHSALL